MKTAKSTPKRSWHMFPKGTKYDFSLLFFEKEGKVLLGKRYSNFIFMFLILFMTFLAIGIANGSLDYLEQKMNDPFINWISVPISSETTADTVTEFIKRLNEDTVARKEIEYSNINAFTYFSLYFILNGDNSKEWHFKGRTIEANDPLIREIFNRPGNKLSGNTFSSNKDLGLIVTKKMLERLNYKVNSDVLYLNLSFEDPLAPRKLRGVPIPVIAVVEDLPGMTDFFCTPDFHIQRYQNTVRPFDPSEISHVELVTYSLSGFKKLEAAVREFTTKNPTINGVNYQPWVFADTLHNAYKPAYRVRVALNPDSTLVLRDSLFNALLRDKQIAKLQPIRFYDFYSKVTEEGGKLTNYDQLSIKVENLAKIDQLQNHLEKRFNLRLEMSQKQTRENYFFIANLTNIISLTLIVFSILSICLFISSLLKNHLERMKMNIGTFKAFGLENKILARIYVAIIFIFILVAMAFAILFSTLLGYAGGVRGLFILMGRELEEGTQNYFNLFKPWSVELWPVLGWAAFSIVMIFLTSYLVLRYITGKIFSKTPGDLIYDR